MSETYLNVTNFDVGLVTLLLTFKQISNIVLMFSLLTLNKLVPAECAFRSTSSVVLVVVSVVFGVKLFLFESIFSRPLTDRKFLC